MSLTLSWSTKRSARSSLVQGGNLIRDSPSLSSALAADHLADEPQLDVSAACAAGKLAERRGFEPLVPCGTPDFESGTFGLSVISPPGKLLFSGRSVKTGRQR
jgi:hypothetical protein